MRERDSIRRSILDHAFDEANLWDLPGGMTMIEDGREVVVHPPRSDDEIRPVLEDLLNEGYVTLYRLADNEQETQMLSLDDALAAIAVPDNWLPTAGIDLSVSITEAGQRECNSDGLRQLNLIALGFTIATVLSMLGALRTNGLKRFALTLVAMFMASHALTTGGIALAMRRGLSAVGALAE